MVAQLASVPSFADAACIDSMLSASLLDRDRQLVDAFRRGVDVSPVLEHMLLQRVLGCFKYDGFGLYYNAISGEERVEIPLNRGDLRTAEGQKEYERWLSRAFYLKLNGVSPNLWLDLVTELR